MSTAAKANQKVIDVTTFGAVAGDGKDDTKAVLAALEECIKSGPSTLIFPKGKYDFFAGNNPKSKTSLFIVNGANGLVVDGRGSEFVIHSTLNVFSFTNCKRPTLKNLTIYRERPPFSVGRVTEVQEKSFDVDVFPEYPVDGSETVMALMEYDPATRLPAHHGMEQYYCVENVELLRKQVLRLHLKKTANIKPGALVLLRHELYGECALHSERSSDVTIKDVNLHSIPGAGFVAGVCTNITLERLRVVPKPGSGYLMSSTADATHFSGCKGTIRMNGCEFEAMGDDGVNIKSGLYLSLIKKVDDRTILAMHKMKLPAAADPGDVMEISHSNDLLPYAKVRVKKMEILPDNVHRVEFEEALPAEIREDDVFGNATRVPKVRIRNCQVRNNRARGMLIQTRDVVVENCTFRNTTGPGLLVLTEAGWFYESIGTRDVTIRNNKFEHCNYGVAIGPGALCSMAFVKDFKYPTKPGVHKNVTFEGNIIRDTDNSGIFVVGTDGITLKGNTIENSCADTTDDTGKFAIYVSSSKNIQIKGNTVNPKKQNKNMLKALQFGDKSVQDAALVEGNKGF